MTTSHIPEERRQRIATVKFDFTAQETVRVHACNLCKTSRLTVITHADRYGYPAKATSCTSCGLTCLNPVMSGNAYGEFYANTYRPLVSAYHGRLIDAKTIQAEQEEYAAALVDFMRPWMDRRRQKVLLDIGGSTGVVARRLVKEFSLKASVLDPAAAELDWAAKDGMETIAGFLEQYDPGKRRFDLVTLCQTIDHLTDALGSLRKIHRLLASDGLFFVDIVDFRAAYLRQKSIEGAIKVDHPYYFTEDTVELLLQRTGFAVIAKNYAADHLHVGYLCRRAKPVTSAPPKREAVREFFREIRHVQNAGR
jgi:ubiquinone/menaquinone biosynthesis C-methylase UbiE